MVEHLYEINVDGNMMKICDNCLSGTYEEYLYRCIDCSYHEPEDIKRMCDNLHVYTNEGGVMCFCDEHNQEEGNDNYNKYVGRGLKAYAQALQE